MAYNAEDAMRDAGYSDEEVELAIDMDVVEEYLVYPRGMPRSDDGREA